MNKILSVTNDVLADLNARSTITTTPRTKAQIRDLRRKQSAIEALDGLTCDVEIYGFTKGQFSVIDLIEAALTITGPAHLLISTWTAAQTDVQRALNLVASGTIITARWLVDLTFQRRTPALAQTYR